MNELLTAISTGITAFTATNLDDILILLLFFSQVNAGFRRRQIIAGQYLGFAALVCASLPGFFGRLIFPPEWIGRHFAGHVVSNRSDAYGTSKRSRQSGAVCGQRRHRRLERQ